MIIIIPDHEQLARVIRCQVLFTLVAIQLGTTLAANNVRGQAHRFTCSYKIIHELCWASGVSAADWTSVSAAVSDGTTLTQTP